MPKVYLLGEPRAVIGKKEYRLQPNRRCQLLAYLAYKQERVSRDQLADVFWSQGDSGAARRNLRKVLFEAKNLEWAQGFDHDEGGASWLIASDIAEFMTALKEKDWSTAVQTYGGTFLQGLGSDDGAEFDVWLEQERLRLEELYQEAAENHVETLERQGKSDEAVEFLKGLLARDALNETLHRQVMRLEFKRGNSEAALEQFERCREVLQKELGVEPLPETLELLKSIEQGGGTQAKRALLLKSANAVPNLPVNLVGREKLLQEAMQLLQKGERVLLHGFGGMGKTALAAEVTTLFLSGGNTVLWLQVGSDMPDTVLEVAAQPFAASQDVAQAENKPKALQSVLQKHQISLVVLDDVWNAYTLSKMLEALPKGVPLLITSRQRYPRLKKIYVDKLERKASLELLNVYAQKALDKESLEELCELLGDHAFALRLAGLALKDSAITAKVLYEQIKHNPHEFEMPGELREAGQESVASLLSVSLETLEDRSYETFLSYGLLESPAASSGFLARCLDRDANSIEDALFALVQCGLAERVSKPGSDLVSYRVHDLAHSYAKANRFQRPKTLVRSALSYLQAHKDEVELLELDILNILAAAEIAKGQKQDEDLETLLALLVKKGKYYHVRGLDRKAVALLETAATKVRQRGDFELTISFLSELGDYYQIYLGDDAKALEYYQSILALDRQTNSQTGEALRLALMGQIKARQGKTVEAQSYSEKSYHLAKETGDPYFLIDVLEKIGYVAGTLGDLPKAKDFFAESLVLISSLKQTENHDEPRVNHLHFFTLLNLGECEFQLGHFDNGLELRREALLLSQQSGNQLWTAMAHNELGQMYHARNERLLAHQHLSEALRLFEHNHAAKYVEAVTTFIDSHHYQHGDTSA